MAINQSSLIAFYLLAAFVVFITMRGELPLYLGFFLGNAAPSVDPLTGAQDALGKAASAGGPNTDGATTDKIAMAAKLGMMIV